MNEMREFWSGFAPAAMLGVGLGCLALLSLTCAGCSSDVTEPKQAASAQGTGGSGTGGDGGAGDAGGDGGAGGEPGKGGAGGTEPAACYDIPCPEDAPVDTCPSNWTLAVLVDCPAGDVPQHCMVSSQQGWRCKSSGPPYMGVRCCCPDGVCF